MAQHDTNFLRPCLRSLSKIDSTVFSGCGGGKGQGGVARYDQIAIVSS